MRKILGLIGRFAFLSIGFLAYTRLVTACTRIFWNTNPGGSLVVSVETTRCSGLHN
jgi:hypothetical protein